MCLQVILINVRCVTGIAIFIFCIATPNGSAVLTGAVPYLRSENITAITARKALENSLDRAYLQVLSGAFTREQAIKNAVTDLAKQGITKIAYPSGSSISVEAGIRRAVTTGINQTVAELQIARAGELGSDLVETSSHSGARPSHAVWQGQVFSLSGRNGRIL